MSQTQMTNYCPDCGVEPGKDHLSGCDVERCRECGHQLISCDCQHSSNQSIPWSGEWPGVVECREFGWYSYFAPGRGWVPCGKNHPEASEDLNRLYMGEAKWDKNKGRFVK